MFAFLLRFYDENSTIYMIVCCLMLLLWLYFVHMEFFPSPVDSNRLDMDLCGQQKSETRTISCDSMRKEIPWIKGKVEYYIRITQFATKKCSSHTLLNANKNSLFAQCQTNATDFPRILQQMLRSTYSPAAHHWHGSVLRTSQLQYDWKIPATMVIACKWTNNFTFSSRRTIELA